MAVVLLGAALYARALAVPWYLDDFAAIVRNPAVRTVSLATLLTPRGVAYFSFALNRTLLGPDPAGFHAVNVAVHLAAGVVVFALLRRIAPGPRLPALGGALVFVLHPLQTQAVTYATQRMTSLAALFFLSALLLFLRARHEAITGASFRSARHLVPYVASLLLALLAMLTKENAVVFPLVALAASFVSSHDRGRWRSRGTYLASFFAITAAFAVWRLAAQVSVGSGVRVLRSFDWTLVGYGGPGEAPRDPTPFRYLVTEWSVVWEYLRLVVWPWGQSIDHGYPLVASYATVQNAAAALGLCGAVALAWRVRYTLPLFALGVAVFLLGLAVESTVIPLDTMVEHRLYLPMFGVVLAVVEAVRRIRRRSVQALVLAVILVPLSTLTWMRNALWADPVAFYESSLEVHPDNPRLWTLLAGALRDAGYRRRAEIALAKALDLHPTYAVAMVDLGALYADDGRPEAAETMYRNALAIVDGYSAAHRLLGILLTRQRRDAEALSEFAAASRLAPTDADALFFEALTAHDLGRRDQAVRAAERLAVVDPARAARVFAVLRGDGSRLGDHDPAAPR